MNLDGKFIYHYIYHTYNRQMNLQSIYIYLFICNDKFIDLMYMINIMITEFAI